MGADVIKVERPGVGDITRGQLRDVPNADSLYFTMLNGNKRSITIDSKHPKGREILEYCRGPCCVLAFEAVALLRDRGFRARRLEDGYPEWKAGCPRVKTHACPVEAMFALPLVMAGRRPGHPRRHAGTDATMNS